MKNLIIYFYSFSFALSFLGCKIKNEGRYVGSENISINWQAKLDSVTTDEVMHTLYNFHDEYGFPKRIIVSSAYVDSAETTVFISNGTEIFTRVAMSKNGDTLYVQYSKPRNSKGLKLLPTAIEDVLFNSNPSPFNEDDD